MFIIVYTFAPTHSAADFGGACGDASPRFVLNVPVLHDVPDDVGAPVVKGVGPRDGDRVDVGFEQSDWSVRLSWHVLGKIDFDWSYWFC